MITEKQLTRGFALFMALILAAIVLVVNSYCPPPVVHSGGRGIIAEASAMAPAAPASAVAASTTTNVVDAAIVEPLKVPVRFEYVVKPGEWLIKISARYCNDPNEVAATNNIENPNLIHPGQRIALAKVEPCTPESAKSRTSPEMRVAHTGNGASRDKSSRPDSEHDARPIRNAASERENCARASWRIKELAEKLLAQAECIEAVWGDTVREAIAEIDSRIDYYDVIAVITIESSGDPIAVSPKDCKGLMQLHPNTVTAFGVKHVFDPTDNIRGGVKVLSEYIYKHFDGNRTHGMVAYNIGPFNKAWKFKRFRERADTFGYYRQVNSLRERLAGRTQPSQPPADS